MPLPRSKAPSVKRPRRSKASTWVMLEERLNELEGTWGEGDILNLPGWKVIKYRETAQDIVVLAEITTDVGQCTCGAVKPEVQRWAVAYARLYDERGGTVEIELKESKQGIGFTKRNKKKVCGATDSLAARDAGAQCGGMGQAVADG